MLVLITGGSGSGKSAFAEDMVLSFGEGPRVYIATMFPFDKESEQRIERHRRMRAGKGFKTIECYTGLKAVRVPKDSVVLLECMSNLTANEMFQENGAHEESVSEILAGVKVLWKQVRHLVIVTNEIFSEAAVYEGKLRLIRSIWALSMRPWRQKRMRWQRLFTEFLCIIREEEAGNDEKPLEQLQDCICDVFQNPGAAGRVE